MRLSSILLIVAAILGSCDAAPTGTQSQLSTIASTDAVQSVHAADVKSTRFSRRKPENQGVDSEERAVVSTSAINKALKNLGLADDTVLKNLLSKGDVETFLTNSKGVQKVVVNTNGVKKTFTNFNIDLLRDLANPAIKKQISAWHTEGLKLKDIPVKLRADKSPSLIFSGRPSTYAAHE